MFAMLMFLLYTKKQQRLWYNKKSWMYTIRLRWANII